MSAQCHPRLPEVDHNYGSITAQALKDSFNEPEYVVEEHTITQLQRGVFVSRPQKNGSEVRRADSGSAIDKVSSARIECSLPSFVARLSRSGLGRSQRQVLLGEMKTYLFCPRE